MVTIAKKTLAAIEDAIKADQGASFRGWLEKTIPHMADAYSTNTFPFRNHMGASGIGSKCARAIWYGFRWVTDKQHDGRLLRLFNRGHLEEARFIAMMLMIGVKVWQHDENGKQFTISDAGGHFGGSGDGVALGIPDLDPDTPVLLEFKTSALKQFESVKKKGVREAKFEHYVQMQVYMRKMGIAVALYMVVCKNNDELYAEIVTLDTRTADTFINRGVELVFTPQPPKKISNSPAWFECKWCDHYAVCHKDRPPERNCRTCSTSVVTPEGEWVCGDTGVVLDKAAQYKACNEYSRLI
jgi:hypothetical protein